MARPIRTLAAIAAAALLAVLGPASARALGPAAQTAPRSVAVIVHPDNPVEEVKLGELASLLKLDRQFWPNRKRVSLLLPPNNSPEKRLLNDRIYRMDEAALRKYWVGKVFSGEIPSIPSAVRSSEAACRLVARSEGALSVVLLDEVPDGVRVLRIDGLAPGEEGYPLTVGAAEASALPR